VRELTFAKKFEKRSVRDEVPRVPRSGPKFDFLFSFFNFCITQLKAQGPSRTSHERKQEEEYALRAGCPPQGGGTIPQMLQGYLAHEKHPPPDDHHMVLLQGPRWALFVLSEVPL
jgi:hypothetical protein